MNGHNTTISVAPGGHLVYQDPAETWVDLAPPPGPAPQPADEDRSDIEETLPDGTVRPLPAGNVVDGVAHFVTVVADNDDPDMCGGCGQEWPCPNAPHLLVTNTPDAAVPADIADDTRLAALNAAREVLGLAPATSL